MSNVVRLHLEKQWRAVLEYVGSSGAIVIEHYFEEVQELHAIIEHGPDRKSLIKCTLTLNRHDGDEAQEALEQPAVRPNKLSRPC